MEAIPVEVRRTEPTTTNLATDIARAETIAKLMDSQFEIAGIKFGADALIGLIPVAGDAITTIIGMYPLMIARKHNLGGVVIGRMLLNLGIDFAVGSVPLLGDAFDVWSKANLKNVALLKKAAEKRKLI
jgi:hypothetical protein